MTYKEAREYLRPVADNCVLPQYAEALEVAIGALDKVEALEAELKDERDRHDKYVDYAVERDGMIDQLKKEAERMNTVLRLCFGGDPCLHCRWGKEPLPCAEDRVEDIVPCWECKRAECVCYACRDFDKWEMEEEK